MARPQTWQKVDGLPSRGYVCGHCGNSISSAIGYAAVARIGTSTPVVAYIYICHHCTSPTYFSQQLTQHPGSLFGDKVEGIEEPSVARIYDEARQAYSAAAYTAAVLCCRKLLMHIGVAKGAAAGGNFVSYVEFLRDNHYVPRDAAGWVDHIRKKGNEANHEIVTATKEEAEELISFSEMLLKVIFEFPAAVRRKNS